MYDPKDRVAITEAKKRGEWYEVKGRVGDRHVSVGVHAKDVERPNGTALIRRSLLGVAESDRK